MAAKFWVGGSGNTSDVNHWAATSGGAGGVGFASTDDLNFDANSGTAATVTVDVALSARTITFNKSDLAFVQNASVTCSTATSVTVTALASWTSNDQAITIKGFNRSADAVTTYSFGASAIANSGNNNWDWSSAGIVNLTISANTAILTQTLGTIQGRGVNWHGMSVIGIGTGTVLLNGGGTGMKNLTRTGATTDILKIGSSMTLTGTLSAASVTLTLHLAIVLTLPTGASMQAAGASGSVGTLNSDTPGTRATIAVTASDRVSTDYLTVQDIKATGPTPFYMGSHSTDVSNNLNLQFTAPPVPSGGFLAAVA